jgi:glyoxylase-like metal-dependent hydrolase (beta-lactamase superfamily II)
MQVQSFYDKDTATFTYVVNDVSKQCVVIDPVLDYDMASGRVSTHSADRVVAYVREQGLKTVWILETHAHADHLTGSAYLKKHLGGKVAIGAHIRDVLRTFIPMLDIAHDTHEDGRQFDRLLEDGEVLALGEEEIRVMHTPGHTPACVSYLIGDAVFVGDTVFAPAMGAARTDFPGGSAVTLYRSIQKLFALPGNTRMYVGHDYPSVPGQERCMATVDEQRASNVLVHAGVDEASFVSTRQKRDSTLAVPRLLFPSLQVNLRAGHFGEGEVEGKVFLKTPVSFSDSYKA